MRNQKFIISLAIAAMGAANLAQAEEQVPLKVEFPPPFLIGTPVAVKLPHLEPVDANKPVIMVPADAKNLAEGKTVTSSDDFPIIGDLEYVTDGDKESEEGYFVELAPGTQWIQIDLGKPSDVYAIALWHFHTQKRAYSDVIAQLSDDPDFKKGVSTVFNNDHDNSVGMGQGEDYAYLETNEGKLINVGGKKAQYVRLYSAGNTSNEMNHYVEVEVFGTQEQPFPIATAATLAMLASCG